MTTTRTRGELRAVKGCEKIADRDLAHFKAIEWADHCDPCLDLLMEAARAGAVRDTREEYAKLAESLLHDVKQGSSSDDLERSIGHNMGIHAIADAIRLLKPSSPPATECEHDFELVDCNDQLTHLQQCRKCRVTKP